MALVVAAGARAEGDGAAVTGRCGGRRGIDPVVLPAPGGAAAPRAALGRDGSGEALDGDPTPVLAAVPARARGGASDDAGTGAAPPLAIAGGCGRGRGNAGAFASAGALVAAPCGSRTRFGATGCERASAVADTAVNAPGTALFTYWVGGMRGRSRAATP